MKTIIFRQTKKIDAELKKLVAHISKDEFQNALSKADHINSLISELHPGIAKMRDQHLAKKQAND
jgi:hypothetical protein